MQRGCMKNAALVLAQKTFSFQRKLNFNFTQKNFFCQNCVCKMVDPKFETGFWPLYWVSSGGWWLYGLVYPHRFSGSQEKNLNWLLVLNMLGFINKNKILTFFPVMAATQILLYSRKTIHRSKAEWHKEGTAMRMRKEGRICGWVGTFQNLSSLPH